MMHEVISFIRNYLINSNTILGALVLALVIFGSAFIATRLIRVWSKKIIGGENLFIDQTSARFLGKLLELVVLVIAVITYAHLVPFLHQFGTALLTSAGILSIIIGLAAQNALGNLFAGIALLFYRPFAVGELITIINPRGSESGIIKDFSLGYTKLLTKDGRIVLTPNSLIMTSVLIRNKPQD